jgi:polyisoprenoid-binding protein YceI
MMFRTLTLVAAVASGAALSLAASPQAGAATYTVDTVHSTAIFRVKHMNTSYSYGRFNDITGQFAFDDQDPAQGRFDLHVKTDSIDTGNAARDKHLKGPDFFNVVQYPSMSFKSTSVTKEGDDAYKVVGDLTLHGVTKPITIKVTRTGSGKDMKGRPVAGFETHFSIKRTDYKMGNMTGPVGDEVTVIVSVEGAGGK